MPDTFGQRLKQARIARGWTVEEAAQATRIRAHYIQALEEDRADIFPSPVHRKGFLRNYAELLGVSLEAASPESTPTPSAAGGIAPAAPPPTREAGVDERRASPRPEPVAPPLTPQDSQRIFIEIGQALRKQREQLGLSLADVETHTHLRLHYLKAMEEGDLASLPSMVQSRGMLNNYARFLNLDPDTLLDRFADALQARRTELIDAHQIPAAKTHHPAAPPASRGPIQRVFSLDLLLGSGLIIFLVTFIIFATTQVLSTQSQEGLITQTAPNISDFLLGTGEATQTTPTIPATLTPAVTQAQALTTPLPQGTEQATAEAGGPDNAAVTGRIQLYVVAKTRAWMRITVDNKVEFEGRTQPGSAYPFGGDQRVELLTGDASGIQVYYNQSDLGSLGSESQVVDLIFTAEGMQSPTPTVTPTSTRTPRVTATQTQPTPTLPANTLITPSP